MLYTEWNHETEKEVLLNDGITIGMQRGMQKGMQRGMQQGMQKGKLEGRLETARNLVAMGMSVEQIIKATGLTIEEIQRLMN